MLKLIFYIISFLALPDLLDAQQKEPNLLSLTTRDGLSSNTVYDMVQDANGFLWIATADGLNRFDGTEVVKFLHDSTPQSIPSNFVRCLQMLPNNKMAIGTAAGFSLFDLEKSTCKNFFYTRKNGMELHDNFIQSITPDTNGNLWLCTPTAILNVNPHGKLLRFIPSAYTKLDIGKERFSFINKIITLGQKQLLFFLANGNFVYDLDKNKLEDINKPEFSGLSFLRNKFYSEVFEAGNNYLLFFKRGIDSIFLFNKNDKTTRGAYYPYERGWKQTLSRIDSNQFIISNQSYGCNVISIENHSIKLLKEQYDNYQIGKSIRDIQGNIWYINYLGGLLKKTSSSGQFYFIPLYDKASGKMIDVPVNFIMPLHHYYYLSSYGKGLFIYDTLTGHQKQIKFQGNIREADCNYVWQITMHHPDTLWVGTQGGMFWLIKNEQYGRLPAGNGKPAVMDSVAISIQYTDAKGRLWIGLGKGNGICLYDKKKNVFTYFKGKLKNGYPLRYPMDIAEDRNGRLWFVSDQSNTLLCFDEDENTFIPVNLPSLENISFTCIFIDTNNIFWIGSNAGIIRYNPLDLTVTVYGREKGLCNSYVEDITEDAQGNLWINTDGGLACFNKAGKLFTNFYQSDGLPSEFLDFRFHSLPGGRICTAGFGGLILFDPHLLLKISKKRIPLLITGCKINGHAVYFPKDKIVSLSSTEKDISFQFSGVNLSSGTQNNYLYRLLGGGDHQWINLGRQRQINFSNLSPGKYILSLRCVDEAGNIISKDAELAFHIKVPFTQTIWFYFSILALAFLIFYEIYKYRINQIKKLEKVRSTISRDLHDEIGANLTNISYQSLVGKMNAGNKEKVEESFLHIYQDSHKVSEAMREIIWNINPANDLLENALPRMLQYATELLEARQIKVEAALPPQAQKLELPMEQRRDLYLIFKEAINNIAKHANATRVKIIFSVKQRELTLQILDDGIGYNPNTTFPGNGIRNMKNRAAKHHWELGLNEQIVNGSSFYLRAHLA